MAEDRMIKISHNCWVKDSLITFVKAMDKAEEFTTNLQGAKIKIPGARPGPRVEVGVIDPNGVSILTTEYASYENALQQCEYIIRQMED